MPRVKPVYVWPVSEGQITKEELRGSSVYHRVSGKKGKGFKSDTIPRSLPTANNMSVRDVHYGSHKSVERQIGDAMRELGL